ncbi:hypothetical protein WICMUC_002809 [Wickerhamomyces mucosus]|uniref:Uncharacterized protein n=1 Tax=Wickerhamomyces mucosus TaxID=1378264 RepID=A0A9P8TD68_9ASCO|nr:hypothetical protein WICMUC_002809 [Wickerhamomyces mucosus]
MDNIPNCSTYGKLRFDESGKNKLGETAEINSNGSGFINTNRNLWGSWIGFNAQLIIDEQGLINFQSEFINSLNWKIVYQPEDSMITI